MSSSSFGTSFSNNYRIKGEIVGLRMLVYLVNSFFLKKQEYAVATFVRQWCACFTNQYLLTIQELDNLNLVGKTVQCMHIHVTFQRVVFYNSLEYCIIQIEHPQILSRYILYQIQFILMGIQLCNFSCCDEFQYK